MSDNLAVSYGQAIHAIGKAEGVESRVADELYTFAQAVNNDQQLRAKLTDASIALEARTAAADQILTRAHSATRAAVRLLLNTDRVRHISDIAAATAQIAAEARGASVAEIRTAKPLSEKHRIVLSRVLEARLGRPVDLKIIEDPDLLGGIVVQIGDTVIDGSSLARLNEIKAAMSA